MTHFRTFCATALLTSIVTTTYSMEEKCDRDGIQLPKLDSSGNPVHHDKQRRSSPPRTEATTPATKTHPYGAISAILSSLLSK
jgi:hypothetical protein